MQRAGLAIAQLAMALAPHARVFWIACGPGNNGGDGFACASHLSRWGKTVVASTLSSLQTYSAPAQSAYFAALEAGVNISAQAPEQFDFCIDALFGIGTLRPFESIHVDWIERMNSGRAPVLAIDLPSGLQGDTGVVTQPHVRADHTLSLLTLKPGQFTNGGRDACGEIWFHGLDCASSQRADATLIGDAVAVQRPHNSHKGSFGDVAIIGGAKGMTGAALLAASAALHGGAGRVYVQLEEGPDAGFVLPPECMLREFEQLPLAALTVVAGCGAGPGIHTRLEAILQQSARLVLDADALNQIAQTPHLETLVALRPKGQTVITPHPLEAARLLGCDVARIQADRVSAARQLSEKFRCVALLKGSGTVVCAPDGVICINPTGNAKLASAGTGDVLAGLIGARMAAGLDALDAASSAAHLHGLIAQRWPAGQSLTAGALAAALMP